MSLTVTVPKLNGAGQIAAFTLQLPAGAPAGAVAWTSGTPGTGTVTPSNDGQSALFTPVAAGSSVITAEITQGPAGLTTPWIPGTKFLVGAQIVDQHGNVQEVTSATHKYESTYTPLAGDIPEGGYEGYFFDLAVTSCANASGLSTVYTTSATLASGTNYAGRTFRVAGFITNALNNGQFVCTANSTGADATITLDNPNGIAETPAAGANIESIGFADDPLGNSRVLNQGDGDINGDWPAGALLQAGANTNSQVTNGAFTVKSSTPTTAAPVTFVSGGYSSGARQGGQDTGGSNGLESPAVPVQWFDNSGNLHTDFTSDSRITIASYTPYGPSGTVTYIDADGNSHSTGWVIAEGTQDFTEAIAIPPAFATAASGGGSGPAGNGTTIDGDLVWTYQAAAADTTTYNGLTVTVSTAAGVPAVNNNYLIIQ